MQLPVDMISGVVRRRHGIRSVLICAQLQITRRARHLKTTIFSAISRDNSTRDVRYEHFYTLRVFRQSGFCPKRYAWTRIRTRRGRCSQVGDTAVYTGIEDSVVKDQQESLQAYPGNLRIPSQI